MMKAITCLTLGILLLASAGCGKKDQAGIVIGNKQRLLSEMAPEDVIVSVNGETLTKKGHEARIALSADLYAYRTPTATLQQLEVFRKSREQKSVLEYINSRLAQQEAKRLKISLSPEAMKEAEQTALNNFLKGKKTPEEFYGMLGKNTDLFKEQIQTDALVRKMRQTLYGKQLAISEADIDAVEKKITDWNAVYALSNQVVVARGAEIVRQLRAGADFAQMAKEVSQHRPEDGVLWSEFTRAEIPDPELVTPAFSLPVGAVSDPIETKNGLVIIKVLERTDGTDVEAPVSLQVATVKLAKILLLMYNAWDEMTRPQIRAEIERNRIVEIQQEWMSGLWKTAHIEYPNGTNLWAKASTKKKPGLQFRNPAQGE